MINTKKSPTIYFKMIDPQNRKEYKFVTEKDLAKEYKNYCFSFSLFHRKTDTLKTALEWLRSEVK